MRFLHRLLLIRPILFLFILPELFSTFRVLNQRADNFWRVTKYDPKLRDENGAYQGDDWIMWQEIGKTFNGKKFTLEDYLDMESRYVEAAMAFLADSGVDKLTAYDVVTGEPSERIVALGLHQQITLKNRQSVTPEQIPTLLRAMLREDIGCSFAAPRKFTLSVGWDYYMYISCHTPAKNAVAKAEALGLYVEPLDPLE